MAVGTHSSLLVYRFFVFFRIYTNSLKTIFLNAHIQKHNFYQEFHVSQSLVVSTNNHVTKCAH